METGHKKYIREIEMEIEGDSIAYNFKENNKNSNHIMLFYASQCLGCAHICYISSSRNRII